MNSLQTFRFFQNSLCFRDTIFTCLLLNGKHTCIPLNLAVGEYTEPGKCQVEQSFFSVPDQKKKKQTNKSLQKLILKQVKISFIT